MTRDLDRHAGNEFDIIIIGGGIYGVFLAFEARRRQLKTLLVEKNDFGGETSLNHLRTLHGGLRYLQSLDLVRFRESVGERRWFIEHFPKFVEVMPCLMPLYDKGLQRREIFKMALPLNDLLSLRRNHKIPPELVLPRGRTIPTERVNRLFPGVDRSELRGGAIWYDASVPEHQRMILGILNTANANGAVACNYCEATGLLTQNGRVTGITATDRATGGDLQFQASLVLNATGPWSRATAKLFDRDHPELFPTRLRLWNVLFNREALSEYSLALTHRQGSGHTYFIHPWKDRLLVGSGESVVGESPGERTVPEAEMDGFISALNDMIPGIRLDISDIQRVYAGILPGNDAGRLSHRPALVDHGVRGGPSGLFSLTGVKYTTSRLVANRVLNRILPGAESIPYQEFLEAAEPDGVFFDYDEEVTGKHVAALKTIILREAVIHLSDLVLRRTSIGDNPPRARKSLKRLRELFDWDDPTWKTEVERLEAEMNPFFPNPPPE